MIFKALVRGGGEYNPNSISENLIEFMTMIFFKCDTNCQTIRDFEISCKIFFFLLLLKTLVDQCITFTLIKADPGPAHRARPPVWKYFWGSFVNFDCITRLYFNRSQHGMLTLQSFFSQLDRYKNIKYMLWGNKTIPRLLPRLDRALHRF